MGVREGEMGGMMCVADFDHGDLALQTDVELLNVMQRKWIPAHARTGGFPRWVLACPFYRECGAMQHVLLSGVFYWRQEWCYVTVCSGLW